jgi:hypothetical protein
MKQKLRMLEGIMASRKPKIAILVDADNISHMWADAIIEKASARGEIIIRYACGTRKHLGGRWRKKIEEHKYTEKTAPDIENGADILIVKEAMDIMLKRPEIDTFCLVSDDHHFAKVPQIPRQWNKKVLMMGTAKAAKLLKNDSEFILLEKKVIAKPAQQPKKPKKAKKQKPIAEFLMLLEKAFATVNQESIALNTLGKAIKDVDSTYKPQLYGSSTLTKLLKKLPNVVEVKNNKAKLKSWKPYSPKPIAEFQILLEKAFKTVNQESIALNTLGKALKDIDSTYKPQIFGSSTLTKLLKKLPTVTVKSGKATIKKRNVKKQKPIAEFQLLLEKAFRSVNQESIALNTLGKALKDIDSTYKPQIYGSSTLSKLLKKLPNVTVKSGKATIKKRNVKKQKQTPKSKESSKKKVDSGYKEPEPVVITKPAQQQQKIKKKNIDSDKKAKKKKVDSGYKESETFTLLGKK